MLNLISNWRLSDEWKQMLQALGKVPTTYSWVSLKSN